MTVRNDPSLLEDSVPQPRVAGGVPLAAVVIVSLMAALIGAGLTRLFPSDDRSALASNGPKASPVAFVVQLGRIDAPVVARLASVSGSELKVPVPAGDGPAVVTSSFADARIDIGDPNVICSVRDRPVIGYVGAVPTWRELKPLDSGTDVAALQQALTAAGRTIAKDELAEARFGYYTQQAVSDLYVELGFTPQRSPDPENPAEVSGAPPPSGIRVPLGELFATPISAMSNWVPNSGAVNVVGENCPRSLEGSWRLLRWMCLSGPEGVPRERCHPLLSRVVVFAIRGCRAERISADHDVQLVDNCYLSSEGQTIRKTCLGSCLGHRPMEVSTTLWAFWQIFMLVGAAELEMVFGIRCVERVLLFHRIRIERMGQSRTAIAAVDVGWTGPEF